MATLVNRATPRQAQVMKMIEGACRNTLHAHPEINIDEPERFARSVAKRAAGTLTSAWGSVLAASAVRTVDEKFDLSSTKNVCQASNTRQGSKAQSERFAPLLSLRKKLGMQAGEAKRAGLIERHAALVDVLRLIAKEIENV